MAPLHSGARHGLGKDKPPLEGGEDNNDCIHRMVMSPTDPTGTADIVQKIQELCEWIAQEFTDIMNGVPPELPPFREVNHRIPLIDPDKRYHYHLPHCSDAMKPQLLEKMWQYIDMGWWIPKVVPQVAPLLCIPKKSGKIRTVVDCQQRNDNTVKDVTSFPDQDQIQMDVAQAKFRSKIDLSNAYKQVHVEPEDVPNTAFALVYGTMESNVMQQGDCNAPTSFQQLMTVIFHDDIGICVHIYLNDMFIFSASLGDHEQDLIYVLQKLRENHLFLEIAKCDLFSQNMDCLGHVIDNKGLHTDADKMAHIRNWRTPRNLKEVQ